MHNFNQYRNDRDILDNVLQKITHVTKHISHSITDLFHNEQFASSINPFTAWISPYVIDELKNHKEQDS